MPFLRFSRDKRGYEHTYLVHTSNRRGKPSRPRILYWYRTPPGIRVGRPPFDEEVRRTIEANNPGVTFDWKAFATTTIPAAEPEPWWERRRAERAAQRARRSDDDDVPSGPGDDATAAPDTPADDAEERADEAVMSEGSVEATPANDAVEPQAAIDARAPVPPSADAGAEGARRRRRRRGGRRRRGRQPDQPGEPGASAAQPVAQDGESAQNHEAENASEPLDDADDPAENDDSTSEG